MIRRLRLAALAALAALGAGCATLDAPFSGHLASPAPPLRECAEWLRTLDQKVAEAHVRDAQDAPVPGFPYLRASRLLAALRPLAESNAAALPALAERMRALDFEARHYEILNLPAGAIEGLRDAADRPGLKSVLERTQRCGRLLRDADLADAGARDALLERASVPDDYLTAGRVLGLYALTAVPFASGVRRFEEETRAAFRKELTTPHGASLVRYAPPPGPPLPRAEVAHILARAADNPLGIPEPGEAELRRLLAAYAPSFEIAARAAYDRIGALHWSRESRMPEVDVARPVVYAHAAWTRYEGRVLLQLVYTAWFPERPAQASGDILAGRLDGVTWRVTLAPDGEPLLYDSIHPCGCYHLFFPTPRAQARPAPEGPEEWMFAPQALPRFAEGERPLVRLASGTHYLERVSAVRGGDGPLRYELRPYGQLRSLARPDGSRASIFGPDGLVAGSERPERWLFWPMGIESAGTMRQWGRQATAFIGRRHFDDADLLEKRFLLELN
jgi:hypothetical protein